MSAISLPETGESVSVLAPDSARLDGRVTDHAPDALTIELEETPIRRPFRLAAGAEVEVEWVHRRGVMQVAARVREAQPRPHPTLRLGLVGAPELVERRRGRRLASALRVSAWPAGQPDRRSAGAAVELGAGGALLRLPGLPSDVETVVLEIELPWQAVEVAARTVWRGRPDLVGVQFEWVRLADQARLIEFLRAP